MFFVVLKFNITCFQSCISVVPTFIKSTKDHLNQIPKSLKQDVYNSTIIKNATEISNSFNSLKIMIALKVH